MPVQNSDVIAQKQQEKKLALQNEIRQLKKKTTTTKKAVTPRGSKGSVTPRSSTGSIKSTKSSGTSSTKTKKASSTTTTGSKLVLKKKGDSKNNTTVTRRKKSNEKILKESEPIQSTSIASLLLFDTNADMKDDSVGDKGAQEQLLDLEVGATVNPQVDLQSTNPFMSMSAIDNAFNGNSSEKNPFIMDLDKNLFSMTSNGIGTESLDNSLFPTANNGFMEVPDVGDSMSSMNSLQNDVILEEEENTSNQNNDPKDHSTDNEEYYFPENDNENTFDDEFPENESDSELFQYDEENKEASIPNGNIGRSLEEMDVTAYYNTNERDEKDEDEEEAKVDLQEKIRQEIHNTHLRELELKPAHVGNYYKEESSYRSIQSLEDYDDEENSEDEENEKLSASERIQIELLEQSQKERELKEIHRSLSRENLFHYDSTYDSSDNENNSQEEEIGDVNTGEPDEEQDTRTMILREIELSKEREKELKKRHSVIEGKAYDSGEEFENEVDNEIEDPGNKHNNLSVVEKIQLEIDELDVRERELHKKQALEAANQRQDDVGSLNTSLESPGGLVKKPVFGSRDDLVAYFGTDELDVEEERPIEKTPKRKSEKHNSVRIPKIFKKMEAEAVKSIANQSKQQETKIARTHNPPNEKEAATRNKVGQKEIRHKNSERNKHDNPQDHSKKQIIIKKQAQYESLLPNDVEEKPVYRPSSRIKSPVAPNYSTRMITEEWERRSEEEKLKKEQIEREIKRKKEEYLELLQEKARLEENQRIQQQERKREHEEKEREREMLRQKKQGLNELWLSRRSLLTLDDNPDVHDEELLLYETKETLYQVEKPRKRTNEGVTSLQISRTIKRWEKRIAKNNTDQ